MLDNVSCRDFWGRYCLEMVLLFLMLCWCCSTRWVLLRMVRWWWYCCDCSHRNSSIGLDIRISGKIGCIYTCTCIIIIMINTLCTLCIRILCLPQGKVTTDNYISSQNGFSLAVVSG